MLKTVSEVLIKVKGELKAGNTVTWDGDEIKSVNLRNKTLYMGEKCWVDLDYDQFSNNELKRFRVWTGSQELFSVDDEYGDWLDARIKEAMDHDK